MSEIEIPLKRGRKVVYGKLQKDLRRQIETMELPPGAMLPSEAILCKKYRISRTAVRGALGNLEDQGLIHKQPGRGTFVNSVDGTERAARKKKIPTIGINFNRSPESPYFTALVNNLEPICSARNIRIALFGQNVVDAIPKEMYDAAILTGGSRENCSALAVKLSESGVHPVLFNRIPSDPQLAYVAADYKAGDVLCYNWFYKNHCKRILRITVPTGIPLFTNSRADAFELLHDNDDCEVVNLIVESNQAPLYYEDMIYKHANLADYDGVYLCSGTLTMPMLWNLRRQKMAPEVAPKILIDSADIIIPPEAPYNIAYIQMPFERMLTDAVQYLHARIEHPQDTPVLKKMYKEKIIEHISV
jgi:DNA-binding LacI/PurR family transcriptional regulator